MLYLTLSEKSRQRHCLLLLIIVENWWGEFISTWDCEFQRKDPGSSASWSPHCLSSALVSPLVGLKKDHEVNQDNI